MQAKKEEEQQQQLVLRLTQQLQQIDSLKDSVAAAEAAATAAAACARVGGEAPSQCADSLPVYAPLRRWSTAIIGSTIRRVLPSTRY